MADVDIKTQSIKNYMVEFLKEIDSSFLNPNFDSLSYIVDMVANSQTIEGENKQRAFLDKQLEAIEKCLTPVVQAYYSDYNKSLISLTAICDDFHKNQKEVLVLAQRVEDVRQKLSGSHSGIQDLYYEKLLTEYTLRSLKNIEYIRQSPKIMDSLLDNCLFIRASNLYNEINAMLMDSSIAEVPTVISLQGYWDMKKKDIENTLMDRLLTVVYAGDTIEWSSYTNENYSYYELTEEKEKELVINKQYTCSKYTAIAIIIKAATLIGCNMAAQNRLLSNSVGNINEIILKYTNQCITRIEDPTDSLQKGRDALEWTLKNILITCEDIFKTHICCIESFLNSVIEGHLDYSENINPHYNTLTIYGSLQTAIQSFIDKFITASSSISSTPFMTRMNGGSSQGTQINFSFGDSTAWITSQQDVLTNMNDRRLNTNLFSKLCDTDPLLLSLIHFYICNFILQSTILANNSLSKTTQLIANYKKKSQVDEEEDNLGESLGKLSNYLTEHVESDLIPALFDKATSILQVATGRPESFTINEDDGKQLNCILDIIKGYTELEHYVLLLQQNYYTTLPCLSKFIKQVCAKFMNLIDEMVRNSFTKQRSEWGGNGAKLLLFNTPAYKKILEEIPDFPEIEYKVYNQQEWKDEDNAINGDLYSFFVDPPVEKERLLVDGRVILISTIFNGCGELMKHLVETKTYRHANQNMTQLIDLTLYDECVKDCLLELKDVRDYCLELLMNEISGRCFYSISKLITSFSSNSYNNVPPTIMELMKDLRGFSDIIVKNCSNNTVELLGRHLEYVISMLLMRALNHLPVEQVDISIIQTLKQSSVCCSQMINYFLPFNETIQITKRMNDYFTLALMKKEDIQTYIMKNPTRFTNVDYMNLFKIETANRERDDAAIDWIEDIIHKVNKKKSKK